MFHTTHHYSANPARLDSDLYAIRSQMAAQLIGNSVDLLTGSKKILNGIVTGVFTEAGKPKVIVKGNKYDLDQVLTVQPASVN